MQNQHRHKRSDATEPPPPHYIRPILIRRIRTTWRDSSRIAKYTAYAMLVVVILMTIPSAAMAFEVAVKETVEVAMVLISKVIIGAAKFVTPLIEPLTKVAIFSWLVAGVFAPFVLLGWLQRRR